jgi:ABC-type transporter Mla MlaB component
VTPKSEQTSDNSIRKKERKKQGIGRDLPARGNEPVIVTMSGEMLVSGSAAFRDCLVEAFAQGDWVEVDCSNLMDADLTFFQLLCSAHHTAMRENKIFTLRGQMTATFEALARNMGLERHVGCVRDTCQSCIWTGGRKI